MVPLCNNTHSIDWILTCDLCNLSKGEMAEFNSRNKTKTFWKVINYRIVGGVKLVATHTC